MASKLPKLLSPCLHTLPTEITNKETRIRNRHVDLLINSQSKEIIQLRSNVIFYIRRFLIDDDYIEVQTPIIADAAGGAIARPFQTRSVEFVGRRLSLRTAPELWLKRLIIGGFDKIFEIGPCFRNEGSYLLAISAALANSIPGLDLNHNPEFTSCEFYRTFANLEDLIHMTEEMLSGLAAYIATRLESRRHQIELLGIDFSVPFKRLDFIPAIESATQHKLPDLSSPNAEFELLKLFENLTITPPTLPNLPRLLDRLSSIYLEPQCSTPTFIIHHPECISPLSKSFTHPTTHQQVAARAELFINKQEIANTYEEENSPVEQRRKFVSQLRYREEGDPSSIDEDYLQALEWGLPPTGGWGCGIDRLCMLMTGTSRIGDVLPFGTLRNVVALGRSPNTDLLSKTVS